MSKYHDCWTCAKFKRNPGGSPECTADVKGGTMYDGWKPPCENWAPMENVKEVDAQLHQEVADESL